jgi:ankyrin repeat protein
MIGMCVRYSKNDAKLIEAACSGYTERVKELIKAGTNVNTRDDEGRTALMVASDEGRTEIVELLISAGADVNAKDMNGDTALMYAANSPGYMTQGSCKGIWVGWIDYHDQAVWISRYNIQIARILIAAGADVNARDKNGNTALMIATSRGHVDIVEILIDAGADVNAKDECGNTALMIAVNIPDYSTDEEHTEQLVYRGSSWLIYRYRKKIVKILIEAGADVNAKDNEGRTALKRAANTGRTDLVQLLKDAGAK